MEKTETALRISWDGIACGSRGGDIQHYVYQFEAVSEAQNAVSIMTSDRSIERSDLPCNTRYRFRVAGVNEVGMGPFSDDLEAITDFSSGKLNITLSSPKIELLKYIKAGSNMIKTMPFFLPHNVKTSISLGELYAKWKHLLYFINAHTAFFLCMADLKALKLN